MGAPQAFTYRHYQRDAIDATIDYLRNREGNPLVVLPTGAGKSVVISGVIDELLTPFRGMRALMLTHVKELVGQNEGKMRAQWSGNPREIGVYSAGLRRREHKGRRIVFAGIQSVYKRALEMGPFHLIIVDECHLINTSAKGQYRKLIDDLRAMYPTAKVVGFTATPYRTGQGLLTEGEDPLFRSVAYEIGIRPLVEEGYLSPMVSRPSGLQINTAGVGTRLGDFKAKELAERVEAFNTADAVEEVIALGADRKSWLAFCVNVGHAKQVRDLMSARGVSCAMVTGSTPSGERSRILKAHSAGDIRCIVNVGVLTTGYDSPRIDLIPIFRPTKSPGLYSQICGRGLRIHPDKENCMLLDYGGNIERHGPLDEIRPVAKLKGKKGTMPMKVCGGCMLQVPISSTVCGDCGFEFPRAPADCKTAVAASVKSVVFSEPETASVGDVRYARHVSRKSGKVTLKVTYLCGITELAEYVCPQHEGYARRKFCEWWSKRTDAPPPGTVDEALLLSASLPNPVALTYRNKRTEGGKTFPEIMDVEFVPHDVER